MSLVSMLRGTRGKSGFGYASTAEDVTRGLDLTGRTVLITGVNSGLGFESARVLRSRGARILGAARSLANARKVTAELGGDSLPLACDLAEPASVRACVEEVRAAGLTLDVLLCNAGIMALPERTLAHGQELQFLTNHLGHFLLVGGLLPALASKGRVVVLSSAAHAWAPPAGIQLDDLSMAKNYGGNRAYGQSKLANLLFARSLARRFVGTEKTANAVHPGVIATNLARHMNPVVRAVMPLASALAMKSVGQGAATQCYVAVHPDAASARGEYFADCNVAGTSAHGRDDALAERLWVRSREILENLGQGDLLEGSLPD